MESGETNIEWARRCSGRSIICSRRRWSGSEAVCLAFFLSSEDVSYVDSCCSPTDPVVPGFRVTQERDRGPRDSRGATKPGPDLPRLVAVGACPVTPPAE